MKNSFYNTLKALNERIEKLDEKAYKELLSLGRNNFNTTELLKYYYLKGKFNEFSYYTDTSRLVFLYKAEESYDAIWLLQIRYGLELRNAKYIYKRSKVKLEISQSLTEDNYESSRYYYEARFILLLGLKIYPNNSSLKQLELKIKPNNTSATSIQKKKEVSTRQGDISFGEVTKERHLDLNKIMREGSQNSTNEE